MTHLSHLEENLEKRKNSAGKNVIKLVDFRGKEISRELPNKERVIHEKIDQKACSNLRISKILQD